MKKLTLVLVAICSVLVVEKHCAQAQQVPCWPVPNGVYNTILCANGYWTTITPEGETFTGHGTTDPNATARGSGIPLDASGNIVLKGQVSAPTQVLPMLEPFQAQQYGLPPRQD